MDSARFAETKAFESDYTIPPLSRSRDYLIRAFNEDVPYDQFVRENLAGDLHPIAIPPPATSSSPPQKQIPSS